MPEALTTAEIEAAEVAIISAIVENPKLTVKAAVEQAGISRTTYYRLRANRKGFGQRIDEAQAAARQAAGDDLEEFLYDRASDPKNPTGVTAGIFLLKGLKPATYGDRVPKGGGGPITVHIDRAQILLEQQTTDEMRQLEGPAESPDSDVTELRADESDAWVVRN